MPMTNSWNSRLERIASASFFCGVTSRNETTTSSTTPFESRNGAALWRTNLRTLLSKKQGRIHDYAARSPTDQGVDLLTSKRAQAAEPGYQKLPGAANGPRESGRPNAGLPGRESARTQAAIDYPTSE